MIPRKRLAVNTHQKETLFRDDVFAIMQLEDEFQIRHFPIYGVPHNARFLKQFAAGSVGEALACLQGAARCRPIVLAGQRPALEPESEQQYPMGWINYE